MKKEMKEYNWGWWFVLSTIWLACVMIIGLENTSGRVKIMSEGFFCFTLATAVINLLGCIYVGGMPPKEDIKDDLITKAFEQKKRKELKERLQALEERRKKWLDEYAKS